MLTATQQTISIHFFTLPLPFYGSLVSKETTPAKPHSWIVSKTAEITNVVENLKDDKTLHVTLDLLKIRQCAECTLLQSHLMLRIMRINLQTPSVAQVVHTPPLCDLCTRTTWSFICSLKPVNSVNYACWVLQ